MPTRNAPPGLPSMSAPVPCPFQEAAVSRVYSSLLSHQHVPLQMPSSAGKTVTACAKACDFIDLDKTVVFVVHRKGLFRQTSGTYECRRRQTFCIAAGMSHDPTAQIFVAMMATPIHG